MLILISCSGKSDSYDNDHTTEISVANETQSINCDDPISTLEINECASKNLDSNKNLMEYYLAEVFDLYSDNDELTEEIKLAQEKWEAYKDSHCDSIFTLWKDGTIRVLMTINCKNELVKDRTHLIWKSFLVGGDGNQLLPEPEFK